MRSSKSLFQIHKRPGLPPWKKRVARSPTPKVRGEVSACGDRNLGKERLLRLAVERGDPLWRWSARPPDTALRTIAGELVSNVGDFRPVGRIEPLHDVAEVNFYGTHPHVQLVS